MYSPFDRGDAVYLVAEGRVCLYRSGVDGRQFTLAMVDEGSAFGHVALLHAPPYDAYAEAARKDRLADVADWFEAVAAAERVHAAQLRRVMSSTSDG